MNNWETWDDDLATAAAAYVAKRRARVTAYEEAKATLGRELTEDEDDSLYEEFATWEEVDSLSALVLQEVVSSFKHMIRSPYKEELVAAANIIGMYKQSQELDQEGRSRWNWVEPESDYAIITRADLQQPMAEFLRSLVGKFTGEWDSYLGGIEDLKPRAAETP